MPPFKRPDVQESPLRDLLLALHDLHLRAGCPSTRTLQREIGTGVASHTAVHKVFTSATVPTWGLVELLVEAMARHARLDEDAEVERVRRLWTGAANPLFTRNLSMQNDMKDMIPQQRPHSGQREQLTARYIAELLPDALNEVEAVAAGSAAGSFRVPTGFDDLDCLLGGWSRGSLIIIGGRPSSGKTTLLLDFCRAASIRYRLPSMFISAEMNGQEIQTRILSAEARISLHALRNGQMTDDDWTRLARVMAPVSEAPIILSTGSANIRIEQIRVEATRLAQEHGLKLVLVDGLHSITCNGNRAGGVESALRELKDLAENLRIPIVLTAQAQRAQGVFRRRTDIEDLKDGGPIERVGDVVILVDRPDQDEPGSPRLGEADLIVAKNRNGHTATVTVVFQWYYSRFVDLAPSTYQLFTPKSMDRGEGRAESTD